MKKMNKAEMAKFVKSNAKKVSDNLREMITYTLKMYKEDAKSVTAQDFRDLIKDINAELAVATPQASAASLKKEKTKKPVKKAKKEEPEEEAEEISEEEEKPKKKAKGKKKTKKKFESGVVKKEVKGSAIDIAEAFKDEIETPLGVITKDDSIKTIKDVAKILEDGEKEVMCAVYWSEDLLNQFTYSAHPDIVERPESFENDLDLVSIIFVAPNNNLMVGISAYTYQPYVFLKDDMKQKKGIRYSAGAEFNVYTLDVEESEE